MGNPSQSYWASLAMGSCSVICRPTQVNATRLNPCSQTGLYSIYLPRMDGRLS